MRITESDFKMLVKSISNVVREYVAINVAKFNNRLEEFEKQLRAIPAGPPGEQGLRGEKGDPGERGLDGEIGRTGDMGPTGEQGERGEKGDPGEKGLDGKDGSNGLDGKDGAVGASGKDGRDGRDGRDGIDGRDALEIDILPSIPEKSVPRGTFASHKGGLWRAKRNTSAGFDESEWVSIVAAGDSLEVQQMEDLRTFRMIIHRMNGSQTINDFRIPVVIYREIFKEGREYLRGDIVTYGGSAWHCQAESTQDRPGTSSAWVLMVKEGRRGKDGLNGKDGERGLQGTPGRDGRSYP